MPKAPQTAPVMNVQELFLHLFDVLQGKAAAADLSKSQPIGPEEKPLDFIILACSVSLSILLTFLAIEKIGYSLGEILGLKHSKADRFASSFAEFWYYTLALVLGYLTLKDAEWILPYGWDTIAHDGRVQLIKGVRPYTMAPEAKLLYMFEMGWCIRSFLLLVTRKKKKDYWEMFFHHIVTFLLLILSYKTGFVRVGVIVYLLHDSFDPFMHLAKCTHYIKTPFLIPEISFVLCAIVFPITRLYLFPIAIWKTIQNACTGHMVCPGGWWNLSEYSMVGLLVALIPIHCLWFFMIVRVIVNNFFTDGQQGDVRSDDESDDEGSAKEKKDRKKNN